MPIIRRDKGDTHPAAEQDLYTWARNLPPDAIVHVKEASGYVGGFPAHEIQDGTPIEEFLMSEFGVGTFELAGHANGLFLAGRQKVHIGSQADRQAVRHARATRDAQSSGDTMSDVVQVIDMLKTLGWTPGQQADQGANELTNMLLQHAVQSLRPPDPEKTMEQTLDFMKSAQELQRSMAPPPKPKPKKPKGEPSNAKGKRALGEVLGKALFLGANYAMQNSDATRGIFDGVAAKARSAVGRFQQKDRPPTDGESATPRGEPHSASPTVTLDEALESAKTMLATPIGQRMVDYVRGAVHDLEPEEIARHGLEGGRQWLGPDHPLLTRLEENPGRVFDEMSEIVGLTGELWWKARGHFVAMMADEEDETPTHQSSAGEALRAHAKSDTTVPGEHVAREGDSHDSEDVGAASGADAGARPAADEDEHEELDDESDYGVAEATGRAVPE
jgi:hypothetical protein